MPRSYVPRPPTRPMSMQLTQQHVDIARALGHGNFTKGVRRALSFCGRFCRQHDIVDCPQCGKAGSYATKQSVPDQSDFD